MKSGAQQLQDWVERREFNYTEAARFLGIDKSVMTKLANGTRRAGLMMAHKIEQRAGIPAESWLSGYRDTVSKPAARNGRKRKTDK